MSDFFKTLLGGSPGRVIIRLLIFSLLVGIVLSFFNITPMNILTIINNFFMSLWNKGFNAIWKILEYILLGAAIVIPIWLIVRILNWKK